MATRTLKIETLKIKSQINLRPARKCEDDILIVQSSPVQFHPHFLESMCKDQQRLTKEPKNWL